MQNEIFPYIENAFGGTEIMARYFHANVLPKLKNIHKYKCTILPGYSPLMRNWGTDGVESIVWLHNTIDQFDNPLLIEALNNNVIKKSVKIS